MFFFFLCVGGSQRIREVGTKKKKTREEKKLSLSLFLSFSLFQTKENTTNSLVISLSST